MILFKTDTDVVLGTVNNPKVEQLEQAEFDAWAAQYIVDNYPAETMQDEIVPDGTTVYIGGTYKDGLATPPPQAPSQPHPDKAEVTALRAKVADKTATTADLCRLMEILDVGRNIAES